MKRKIYFLFDRLQIRRSERHLIGGLMIVICILAGARVLITPSVYSNPEHQAELERVFLERSEELRRKREAVLLRYVPEDRIGEMGLGEDAVLGGVTVLGGGTVSGEGTVPGEKSVFLRVNINTAGIDSLLLLPGIGPAYAERILKRRQEVGRFTELNQLLEVKGIGPARFEKIRPMLEL